MTQATQMTLRDRRITSPSGPVRGMVPPMTRARAATYGVLLVASVATVLTAMVGMS